ncbi:MAG: class I SAM-dependent methyltransferase [Solirubrobacteraceae bacterium]
MTVVSPAWLELREPADAAARSAELVDALAQHLPPGPLVIHDLGGGSGSMGRWLAPRLPGPQHWVVHDRDEALLELAVAHPPPGATVEARASDITQADLTGADVVVASALLDILTADELAAVLAAARGRPMLFALTVVGRVTLTPADPLDAAMTAAFNAHQRRDGLLGPDAIDAVGGIVRPSPWRLGVDDADLMAEWLDGWVGAAVEQDATLAGDYLERRLQQLDAGELTVTVDHADLLVLP